MKKKSIILQGYLTDANFGDMLVAHLFYQKCKSLPFKSVDFLQYKNYGIGEYCRNIIGYKNRKSFLSCLKSDAYVMISGGSLWDYKPNNDAKRRYNRFILTPLLFEHMKKPVYICGVGGGFVDTDWLRKRIVKMLNKAKKIMFRDKETAKVYKGYGVTNEITITADVVLVLTPDMLSEFEDKANLELRANGRKKILLHLPDGDFANNKFADIVIPGVVEFLKKHREYFVVLSNDNIKEKSDIQLDAEKRVIAQLNDASIDYYEYQYHNPFQLCSLINEMNTIVSSKLHVGVVGTALSKSVLSFPVHREKTDNFYKEIGYYERCKNMRNLTQDIILSQLEKYHDTPIIISKEIRDMAEKNLTILDEIAK